LANHFENSEVGSEDEHEHMKKIFNAVIKKLIKEERMLIIV